MPKTQKWTASTFTTLLHDSLTKNGTVKIKKSDLNKAVQAVFEKAVAAGAATRAESEAGDGSHEKEEPDHDQGAGK